MDVLIRDAVALRRITPAALQSYLETHGWARQEVWKHRIAEWGCEVEGEYRQILVALREYSDTYAVRIAEAINSLAELEQRSQLEVYYDLIGSGADVIRVRPLNGAGRKGNSLGDAVEVLSYARDLMLAAARAAENPGRPVYRGRASSLVAQYLQGVRALPGYGEGGGLTLHSVVRAGYDVQEDMGDAVAPPFERQVTLTLNQYLNDSVKIAEAVLGGAETALPREADSPKVSANFYDAAAALARQEQGFRIELDWAAVRPSKVPGNKAAFPESYADIFVERAESLRRNSPFWDAHITGEVVRLGRERQEEFDGQAILIAELDGRPVALQVHFGAEHRDEVLKAFRDSLEVSLDGDIHRQGRQYELRNPRNFSVVE